MVTGKHDWSGTKEGRGCREQDRGKPGRRESQKEMKAVKGGGRRGLKGGPAGFGQEGIAQSRPSSILNSTGITF